MQLTAADDAGNRQAVARLRELERLLDRDRWLAVGHRWLLCYRSEPYRYGIIIVVEMYKFVNREWEIEGWADAT